MAGKGRFQSGHKKVGGRKKGTPNRVSGEQADLVIATMTKMGSDGRGKDELVGYLQTIFLTQPKIGLKLLRSLLPK
jgi:hypothetical protein